MSLTHALEKRVQLPFMDLPGFSGGEVHSGGLILYQTLPVMLCVMGGSKSAGPLAYRHRSLAV
jgi:hypothetical protein